MQLKEIVAPTMKELFIKEIISLILSGGLTPGEKLLTEREMATQMKVSRSIVNLGMSELENMGFIEIIPRKGAYVSDYIKNGKLDTLAHIANFNGGRFDKNTLDSIMHFRKLNECEGTYLCALNRSEEDVSELKDLYMKIVASDDPDELGVLVFKFHHAILCGSQNNIFPLVYNAFESILIRLISATFTFCNADFVIDYLGKLVDAIERKDADRARTIIGQLLNQGIDEVDKNYNMWFK